MTVNLETDLTSFTTRYAPSPPEPASLYPRSLAQAVEAAVDKIDARCLKPVAQSEAGLAFQSRTLLALLTFCYARQVYSSTSIAAQLRRDLSSLRALGNEVPGVPELLRFRCENRGPLGFCLKLALRFLAEEKVNQGFVTHVKEAHIDQEADRRIIMAMFTDSLELGKAPGLAGSIELCFGVACEGGPVH